ncbi:metallophosphoesterase [Magnetospira sp. QH-2]|uniref:metallophosphoesterase n=1 Tax=Magnetospira sp. (strain QH-2) TaxID=1288970 RepID=UPI00130E89F9|nr:metallophosphoesterase [Magnetospira sp. QH-2]
MSRKTDSYHTVDDDLNLEIIRRQVNTYATTALHLHRSKMQVYVRETLDHPPMRIVEDGEERPPEWAINAPEKVTDYFDLGKTIKSILGRDGVKWVVPEKVPQVLHGESRVAYDGKPLVLNLNGMDVHIVPEIPYGARRKRIEKNWVLINAQSAKKGVYSFLRIKEGEILLLGRGNEECAQALDLPKKVAKRHLNIINENGDLILRVLDEEYETTLSALHRSKDDFTNIGRPLGSRVRGINVGRLQALQSVRDLYKWPMKPLPPTPALVLLREVIAQIEQEPCQPKDSNGQPGAVIELPYGKTTVIVGDLHAQVDNLLNVLSSINILDGLENDTISLVILGDAVHSEEDGELENMDSSVLIMDLIFSLMLRFPSRVFYLLGNHDSFDPEISKQGVLQGVLLCRRLRELRGDEYIADMKRLFETLPYIAKSDEFAACHGGPPSRAMTYEEIIDLRKTPQRAQEVLTSRLNRSGAPGSYTKGDIKRLRKGLGTPKQSHLIVGHTPLSQYGTYWLNAGDIKGHHILYSGRTNGPGIFLCEGSKLTPLEFPSEPLLDLMNSLD